VADAVHTMQATKAAFRLSIKREERPHGEWVVRVQVKDRRRWPEPCRTHRTSNKKGTGDCNRAEVFKNHLIVNSLLADLCAATGVSERTLQQVFLEFYGVSPLQYLKLRRLNLARQCLRDGTPEHTRVTGVALDCGFWELGRFAADYKALFGESPSHTLQHRASWATCHPRDAESESARS
jgi:AraC-like DNA-binding protein